MPTPAAEGNTPAPVVISRRPLLAGLWCILGVLLALSLASNYVQAQRGFTSRALLAKFDVDTEQSLPTFFSVCLLLAAAFWTGLIDRVIAAGASKAGWHWRVLSGGFLFLAVDEVVGLHERLSKPVSAWLRGIPLPAASWTLVAAAGLVILALYFASFLRALPRRTCWQFFFAGAVYVVGGAGVEIPEMEYWRLHGHDFTFSLYTALEEGMEMSGILWFVGAAMEYYGSLARPAAIVVT